MFMSVYVCWMDIILKRTYPDLLRYIKAISDFFHFLQRTEIMTCKNP